MTCSSYSTSTGSATSSYAITTDLFTFSGYSSQYVDGVLPGPTSSDMYYLHRSYTADTTIIRKIKSDNSLSWMAAVSFFPIIKSFSVDSNEKNIYVGSYGTTQLNVWRFLTSTGAIVDAQTL